MEREKRTGLTHREAERRRAAGLSNRADCRVGKTTAGILCSNLFTYFNLIFAVLAVLVISTGSYKNLTFLPVVLLNGILGTVQELRAKRTLERLTLLHAPRTTVIRQGERERIASELLVQGDTVVFTAGDQICADGRVLSGSVRVNESLLTGEEDEIEKAPGDLLLSGSYVVGGTCEAELEKVGKASYIAGLTARAKAMGRREGSEMIRSLDRFVRWAGVIVIPVGLLLFYQAVRVNGSSYHDAVTSMVAAVVGMIPEGLYLLTTIALAAGTLRLSRKRVLLHDGRSIETLARVDVLCVDKTGTITLPEMRLEALVPLGGTGEKALREALCRYVSDSEDGNRTMAALREALPCGKGQGAPPLKRTPFRSGTKLGAITYGDGTLLLGAAEFVLGKAPAVENAAAAYTEAGCRVLVLARQEEPYAPGELPRSRQALGLVVLKNALRENAAETLRYFAEQGVTVKVISGDDPVTVSRVAQQAGIPRAELRVDASALASEEELAAAAEKYRVFGRVTPEQKRLLIRAMKAAGHTVAMTGDGVNDILAMKEADCSVAMASGSDAAAQAAQVVLLDSDFSGMPGVVAEGRQVVNNVRRSASLFLVKNIFSLLLAVFSCVIAANYPLKPTQITLVGAFTIGLPGMLLAFEPNHRRIEGGFLRKVLERAAPAGITDALAVGAVSLCCRFLSLPHGQSSTIATWILAAVGFLVLWRICFPFSGYRAFTFGVCAAGFLLTALILPELFGLEAIPPIGVLLTVLTVCLAEVLLRLLPAAERRIPALLGRNRELR